MGEIKIQNIYNAYFENDYAEKIFYYTGKPNVIGLQAPDYVYFNENSYRYIRLLNIVIPKDSLVDGVVAKIYEQFTLTVIQEIDMNVNDLSRTIIYNSPPSTMNVTLSACRCKSDNDDEPRAIADSGWYGYLTFENPAYDAELDAFPVDATNNFFDLAEAYKDYFILREEKTTRTNEDGTTTDYIELGLWFDIDFNPYIGDKSARITNYGDYYKFYYCTTTNASLAGNYTPLNTPSCYPGLYMVEYLDDSTARQNVNVSNTEIEENISRISKMFTSIYKYAQHLNLMQTILNITPYRDQYIFLYDATFTPSDTETIVKPTSVKYTNTENGNTMATISDDHIELDAGIWDIQVKNGFYLIQGETRLDINVYVNGVIDEELSMSMYLTSNNETDARKAIKNTFASPTKSLPFTEYGNTVEVKVVITNPENIVCENETKVFCTYTRSADNVSMY